MAAFQKRIVWKHTFLIEHRMWLLGCRIYGPRGEQVRALNTTFDPMVWVNPCDELEFTFTCAKGFDQDGPLSFVPIYAEMSS